MCKCVWLSSEPHRRSVELASSLGCEFFPILQSDSDIPVRLARYVVLFYKSLQILIQERPRTLFIQNPSIFLAFIGCLFKGVFRYKIVIDRHSNFKLDTKSSLGLKWRFFHWLSVYTVSRADITIVTNDFLLDLVNFMGGKGFVLQDKFPRMPLANDVQLAGEVNIVVVSTFSDDEPIGAVFEAAVGLPKGWLLHVTGKYEGKKRFQELVKKCPPNVILTGFLPETEYQSLLLSADIVVVLTTEDNLLTCGAYEAISLGKAIVLSDKEALRNYFHYGVLYTDNIPDDLRRNIILAVQQKEQLESDVLRLKDELDAEWHVSFSQLLSLVGSNHDSSRQQ